MGVTARWNRVWEVCGGEVFCFLGGRGFTRPACDEDQLEKDRRGHLGGDIYKYSNQEIDGGLHRRKFTADEPTAEVQNTGGCGVVRGGQSQYLFRYISGTNGVSLLFVFEVL